MIGKSFLAKAAALFFGVSALVTPTSTVNAQVIPTTTAPEFEIPNQEELGDVLEGIYRNSHDSMRELIVDNLHSYDVQKINSLNGTEYRFLDRNTHTAYVFASSEYVLTTDVAGTNECNPVIAEATDCETPTEKRIAIDVYTNVDGFGHLANELNGHAQKSGIDHKKRYDVVTLSNFEATTITLTKNPKPLLGYTQSPVPVEGETNKLIYVGGHWIDPAFYEDGIENAELAAEQTLTHYAQDLIAVQGVIEATTEEEKKTTMRKGRDNTWQMLKLLKAVFKNTQTLTDEQEEYAKRVIESLEVGRLNKETVKNAYKALKAQGNAAANPRTALAVLQMNIPEGLLESHYAEKNPRSKGKREVILSMYLAGE